MKNKQRTPESVTTRNIRRATKQSNENFNKQFKVVEVQNWRKNISKADEVVLETPTPVV